MLHSLFSDRTVPANGLKLSNTNGDFANENSSETEEYQNKDSKKLGRHDKFIHTKVDLGNSGMWS